MMTPYRWYDPPPIQMYHSYTVKVYLARGIVARHVDLSPTLSPCPHCFDPDGTERVFCPFLRDAIRVLLDYGHPPEDWHPADQL